MPISVKIRIQPESTTGEAKRSALQESMEALLFDISELGIGLLSQNSLPWGTLVDVELARSALPLPNRASLEGSMRITGRVIHAIPQGGQYRLGISFIRLEDLDRALIRQLGFPQPVPQDRRRAPRMQLLESGANPTD